ncbi:MAG: alpha-E domain-containing protein [Mailhella sp.]|nr:alpha-E domain-containing protein [Mailhella sp.]
MQISFQQNNFSSSVTALPGYVGQTISPAKANRLYWLGRYAERVSAQLHFLRHYYDLCLDEGHEDALLEYCSKLSLADCPQDRDLFLLQHLFGDRPGCLRHTLNCLNDNSIVLRELLATNTIAYVNLCVATLKHSDHKKDVNINNLQPISDYILAFWGSVLHFVVDQAPLDLLCIGRRLESIDVETRFGERYERLAAEWKMLERRLDRQTHLVNKDQRLILRDIFADASRFDQRRTEMLNALNSLINV